MLNQYTCLLKHISIPTVASPSCGSRKSVFIRVFVPVGWPSVFDPKRKPWIDMDAADSERIVQQVKKCPSGALSILTTIG